MASVAYRSRPRRKARRGSPEMWSSFFGKGKEKDGKKKDEKPRDKCPICFRQGHMVQECWFNAKSQGKGKQQSDGSGKGAVPQRVLFGFSRGQHLPSPCPQRYRGRGSPTQDRHRLKDQQDPARHWPLFRPSFWFNHLVSDGIGFGALPQKAQTGQQLLKNTQTKHQAAAKPAARLTQANPTQSQP